MTLSPRALGLVAVASLVGCRAEAPAAADGPPSRPSVSAPAPAPAKTADPLPPPVERPPSRHPGVSRVVALGDVHGDLQATRAALRLSGAIDEGDRWVGGELVVVQTGDQLDRGNDEPEILDLFDRLRVEAGEAGGKFLALNGNHEVMNVAGDLRYVTPEGFADFAHAPGVDPNVPAMAQLPAPARARMAAFWPGAPWARRLAARNVVVVVGDTVFVHGGVLPAHVTYGVDRLNREVSEWMAGRASDSQAVLGRIMNDDSPVWTRLYSASDDPRVCQVLEETLKGLSVERMVVGHTVQPQGITSACNERVWRIDVGMAHHYGGPVQVLEITPQGVTALRLEDQATAR